MNSCGKILGLENDLNQFIITCEKGLIEITVIKDDIIRVRATQKNSFNDFQSPVIDSSIKGKKTIDTLSYKEYDDYYNISTGKFIITIDRDSTRIYFYDRKRNLLTEDIESCFLFEGEKVGIKKNIDKNMYYYGLGERFGGIELRGQKATLYNIDALGYDTEEQLYLSIPFIIGCLPHEDTNKSSFYGLYSDNTYKTEVDFTDYNTYSFINEGGEVDYYIFTGGSPADIIDIYTDLTGKMDMPPIWSLGYHQSRWGYKNTKKILDLEKTFNEKRIPCDVIHLDIQYMNGKRVFTWDKKNFPNPDEMIKKLAIKNIHVVTIVDPGVKKENNFKIYNEGVDKDLFCKMSNGEIYYGEVWPGVTAFPDYFKEETREWWAGLVASMLRSGVSGIWNDMNEPSLQLGDNSDIDNPDLYHEYDNKSYPHKALRNLYGYYMNKATKMGMLTEHPNKRHFILTRSGFAGIQKYACVWTGDNVSNWKHLRMTIPMLLNLGLSGVSFCGADVGGFTYKIKVLLIDLIMKRINPSKELYARWLELSCLTPFFRTHAILYSKDQEPWSFGKEVENISRKYILLRYQLLPYIYGLFFLSYRKGLPVMRPLFLNYPEDKMSYNIDDEFMVGDNILVAPVVEEKEISRYVYLPAGKWIDFYTGVEYIGRKKIKINAPIDILPLFIRKGSIIPKYEDFLLNTNDIKKSILIVDVYIDEKDTGVHGLTLYEDDGKTNDYKKNLFSLTNYSYNIEKDFINFNIDRKGGYYPHYKILKIVIKDMDRIPHSIKMNTDENKDNDYDKELVKVSENINYKKSTGFCWFIKKSDYFPDFKKDIVIIIPNRKNLDIKLSLELTKD